MTSGVLAHRRTRIPLALGTYTVHTWSPEGERAREAGVALVLLHGFTGSGLVWERPLRALARIGTAAFALAPDLAGHGGSLLDGTVAQHTFEAVASQLEAVLDATGIEQCVLHGYSMGGRLALHFALTRARRVASLSLESASPGLASAQERAARVRADEDLAAFAETVGIETFVDRWQQTPVLASLARLSREERERLRAIRCANDGRGLAASLRGMGVGAQAYLGARLSELAMPVTVMAGADDTKFKGIAQDMAKAIPDANLAIIEDAGHTPHLEQPERWASVIQASLTAGER